MLLPNNLASQTHTSQHTTHRQFLRLPAAYASLAAAHVSSKPVHNALQPICAFLFAHCVPAASASHYSAAQQRASCADLKTHTHPYPATTMALPRLVVFDLDACCWFPEMYMVRRGPPFTKSFEDECKAVDGEAINLLGCTRKTWSTISNGDEWQDCRVAVASRCDEPEWARQLLKLFTIDDGRSFWQALDDGRLAEIYKGNKKTHLKALKEKTGVAFEDMLFFDDDQENIRHVSELGVVSVLTPEGVTEDAWEAGLRRFMEAKLYARRGVGPGYGKTYAK